MQIEKQQLSLNELEGNNLRELPKEVSGLVYKCREACKKRLADLSVEDVRILVGQNISPKYTIPLAVHLLNENVLAEGDFYEGDLLFNVLNADKEFWREYPSLSKTVYEIVIKQQEYIQNSDVADDIKSKLLSSFAIFRQRLESE